MADPLEVSNLENQLIHAQAEVKGLEHQLLSLDTQRSTIASNLDTQKENVAELERRLAAEKKKK